MTSITPEQRARVNIDRLLEQAGWAVQNMAALNVSAARGVAAREFPTAGLGMALPTTCCTWTAGQLAWLRRSPRGTPLPAWRPSPAGTAPGCRITCPPMSVPCRSCMKAPEQRPGSPMGWTLSRGAATFSPSINRSTLAEWLGASGPICRSTGPTGRR